MNIGFVSAWFERGAAYVTKSYLDILSENHEVYVYARGGELYGDSDPNWNKNYVTWGHKLIGTDIDFKHLKRWINKNKIEVVFFNEQRNANILIKIKKKLPDLKIGSYIDYYKEDTIEDHKLFDFLICNTLRHYSVFKFHQQCFYIPWGTDIYTFKPINKKNNDLIFFHSVGMSTRKGTEILINAFIDGKIFEHAKLIIHSQISLEDNFGFNTENLGEFKIEVIEKTITAPGLYFLGDVYVYPTTLDGLGLTLYEALACGLPVITTNSAPMNEVITSDVGYLVEVEQHKSRSDGYYWPLSICRKESLIEAMEYFIQNKDKLGMFQKKARLKAEQFYNFNDRKKDINDIFESAKVFTPSNKDILEIEKKYIQLRKRVYLELLPKFLIRFLKLIR